MASADFGRCDSIANREAQVRGLLQRGISTRLTAALGHSRPSHFVPVLNNVRYASDSDHSRYESELTLWANKRHRSRGSNDRRGRQNSNSQPMAGLMPWKKPCPASVSQGHNAAGMRSVIPAEREAQEPNHDQRPIDRRCSWVRARAARDRFRSLGRDNGPELPIVRRLLHG
jgi:hypothetical protein